jgi:hypothetical protein
MPRDRERVCLEAGLKLDINKLPRRLFIPEVGVVSHETICWTKSYTGELVAHALISTQVQSERGGWLRIQMAELDQWIDLVSQPRHFGGRHWYFRCVCTPRCSVLWMPPGSSRFSSRQNYGREVAYASQFESPWDRAITGREKIKERLIGSHCTSDLPPKPKWMRWKTYARLERKYFLYEDVIDQRFVDLMTRTQA